MRYHVLLQRCGSTLLAQMMHNVPGTRCVSSTNALCQLMTSFTLGEIDIEEHKQLIKHSVRLLCKHEPSVTFDRIFIKFTATVTGQMALIHEVFPEGTFKIIFNTRHPKPCMNSFLKLANQQGNTLAYKMGSWWKKNWDDLPRDHK